MIEETVRKYSDMLYRLAFAKTGNSHDSEDIVQDVFLKLIRSGKTFKDDEHEKAWLIRVTVNTGKNLLASPQRRKRQYNSELSSPDMQIGKLDENLERLENQAVVYPAVMSLPEKYRLMIHLFYYEDMKISDIAKATGLSESTIKSRLHRARAILKEKLKEVDFNEF